MLFTVLFLYGCSPADLLSVVKPSKGLEVDTEIVVGDKQEDIASGAVVGKKETTTNTAETITYNNRVVDQGMSIWEQFLILLMTLLFGWLGMPDIVHMWKMYKKNR